MDAVDQDAATSGRAGADLSAGQTVRPARQPHGADCDLHADQPADSGVDDLHLLQGHPSRHSRSGPNGRRHANAGNGSRAPADQQRRPRFHHVAVADPELERGLLVAEPHIVQCRPADCPDRLLFQSRRAVLGQAFGRIHPRLRTHPDIRLDQSETAGPWPVVRRGQVPPTSQKEQQRIRTWQI